jgi:hypothetical protein
MNEKSPDPERIAALLDGSLSPAEHDAALKELLEDPQALELFVETARLRLEFANRLDSLSELMATAKAQTAAGPPAVVRPTRRTRPWWALIPLGAAATVAALLLWPRESAPGARVLDLVALVTSEAAGPAELVLQAGERWVEPGAMALRGGGPQNATPQHAFRTGLMLAGMRFAVDWSDASAAAEAGAELAARLRSVSGGGPMALRIESVQQRVLAGAAAAELRPELDAIAAELAGTEAPDVWFEAGIWTGIARVASLARSRTFFAPQAAAARRLDGLIRELAEARVEGGEEHRTAVLSALRGLQARIQGGAADDSAIHAAIASVITAAAS